MGEDAGSAAARNVEGVVAALAREGAAGLEAEVQRWRGAVTHLSLQRATRRLGLDAADVNDLESWWRADEGAPELDAMEREALSLLERHALQGVPARLVSFLERRLGPLGIVARDAEGALVPFPHAWARAAHALGAARSLLAHPATLALSLEERAAVAAGLPRLRAHLGPLTVSGTVSGNLAGTVSGTVSGNLAGTVSGTVSGNLAGTVSGNVSGTVSGNLAVEVAAHLPTLSAQALLHDAIDAFPPQPDALARCAAALRARALHLLETDPAAPALDWLHDHPDPPIEPLEERRASLRPALVALSDRNLVEAAGGPALRALPAGWSLPFAACCTNAGGAAAGLRWLEAVAARFETEVPAGFRALVDVPEEALAFGAGLDAEGALRRLAAVAGAREHVPRAAAESAAPGASAGQVGREGVKQGGRGGLAHGAREGSGHGALDRLLRETLASGPVAWWIMLPLAHHPALEARIEVLLTPADFDFDAPGEGALPMRWAQLLVLAGRWDADWVARFEGAAEAAGEHFEAGEPGDRDGVLETLASTATWRAAATDADPAAGYAHGLNDAIAEAYGDVHSARDPFSLRRPE